MPVAILIGDKGGASEDNECFAIRSKVSAMAHLCGRSPNLVYCKLLRRTTLFW